MCVCVHARAPSDGECPWHAWVQKLCIVLFGYCKYIHTLSMSSNCNLCTIDKKTLLHFLTHNFTETGFLLQLTSHPLTSHSKHCFCVLHHILFVIFNPNLKITALYFFLQNYMYVHVTIQVVPPHYLQFLSIVLLVLLRYVVHVFLNYILMLSQDQYAKACSEIFLQL